MPTSTALKETPPLHTPTQLDKKCIFLSLDSEFEKELKIAIAGEIELFRVSKPEELVSIPKGGGVSYLVDLNKNVVSNPNEIPHLASIPKLPNCLFLSSFSDSDNINLMKKNPNLTHLIGRNAKESVPLVVSTLKRFFIHGVGGGLTTYLEPHSALVTKQISEFGGGDTPILSELHSVTSELGCYEEFSDRVRTVAVEFLMNAVIDAHANSAVKDIRRKERQNNNAIKLDPQEKIIVQYGGDRNFFGLCVLDNHGTLSKESVVSRLATCYAGGVSQIRLAESRGAGVGIFISREYSLLLSFSVKRNIKTEALALFMRSNRQKTVATKIKSVSFFMED